MKYGDKGQKVRYAQKCLQKAGSSISLSGYYSIGMVSAVSKYQRRKGLEPTGIIDKKTWKVLKRELPFWKRIF